MEWVYVIPVRRAGSPAGGTPPVGVIGIRAPPSIATWTQAPARCIWSLYTTEKWNVVAVVPLVGVTVPAQIAVTCPVTAHVAAAAGRGVPKTVSETARSMAATDTAVARVALVARLLRIARQK
jgi:hypothetical protein